jgi:molybdopterin converting factor subunit 1
MTQVNVQYYAIFREQAGASDENVETGATTAGELYDELCDRHNFSLPAAALRAVVNEEFADWDTPISDGDRVVFIPPVAGG